MKYIVLIALILLSACVAQINTEIDDYDSKKIKEEYHDPEYVDDCYFYKELICEFED